MKVNIQTSDKELYVLDWPDGTPMVSPIKTPVSITLSPDWGIIIYHWYTTWTSFQQNAFYDMLKNLPLKSQLLLYQVFMGDLTLIVDPKLEMQYWGQQKNHRLQIGIWHKTLCEHKGLKGAYYEFTKMKVGERLAPKCPDCGMKISMPKPSTPKRNF
jgi:hypothetical protein